MSCLVWNYRRLGNLYTERELVDFGFPSFFVFSLFSSPCIL